MDLQVLPPSGSSWSDRHILDALLDDPELDHILGLHRPPSASLLPDISTAISFGNPRAQRPEDVEADLAHACREQFQGRAAWLQTRARPTSQLNKKQVKRIMQRRQFKIHLAAMQAAMGEEGELLVSRKAFAKSRKRGPHGRFLSASKEPPGETTG